MEKNIMRPNYRLFDAFIFENAFSEKITLNVFNMYNPLNVKIKGSIKDQIDSAIIFFNDYLNLVKIKNKKQKIEQFKNTISNIYLNINYNVENIVEVFLMERTVLIKFKKYDNADENEFLLNAMKNFNYLKEKNDNFFDESISWSSYDFNYVKINIADGK